MSEKNAKVLMLAGTGSDVGKTVLVAGLCRLALQRGYNVLPFKPQNMSNNAAVAHEGGEIGRGQWLQAFAASQAPSVDMNPVLLKPQAQETAQVIVQGKLYATTSGRGYQQLKSKLMPAVLQSFDRLCERADLVLVEGAGSVAEINLRDNDIANLAFIGARTNKKISNAEPKDYFLELLDERGGDGNIFSTQAIPYQNRELLEVKNYKAFLAERRKLIAKTLNEFIGECPGL